LTISNINEEVHRAFLNVELELAFDFSVISYDCEGFAQYWIDSSGITDIQELQDNPLQLLHSGFN
jgi:hypothetical protein